MAISRVPGYSLLANLDRQGTDIGITSSGLYVTYWDVVNYRFGINNSAPQQALDVTGNIITSNGHIYTGANISYDVGQTTAWWRTVYAQTITSSFLTGTLLTNAQPNITSIGTLSNINITGNITSSGNIEANGLSLIGYGLINTTGNIIGKDASFASINSSGNLLAATINAAEINTTGNVLASGGVYNALSVNGNIDVTSGWVNAGTVNATGNLIANSGTFAQLNVSSNVLVNGITANTGSFNNITFLGNIEASDSWINAGTINVLGNILATGLTVQSFSVESFNTGNIYNSTGDLTIQTLGTGNINLNAGNIGVVKIGGGDALGLPYGPTTDRPLYPETGYFRYNTDNSVIEFYDGSGWVQPSVTTTISSETINPDGFANTYVLSANASTQGVLVSINGTIQSPITSYNIINNNQIQFTETPLTTDTVEIRFLSGQSYSVGRLQFGTATSVILDAANVNIVGNIQTVGFYNNKPNLLIATSTTSTIDSYSTNTYRTAKYIIQAVLGANVESYETLVTHNNTTATSTTYGIITIGNTLGNISTTLTGSNVNVLYTSFYANTYLTVSRNFYPL